ncbi:MAG TPA: zf-HC2 domain-containing protein [Pyrinomonadaceae bacterium]|nr:zf-HC2 domain-containing protein [Pyrinomonadaceae bacterium]
MSLMSCEETRQALSSYIDDCVSLPARVAIDEHFDRCPVCRAEVADLRSLTRSLSSLARPKPPVGLADTISDLLTIEATARQAIKPSFSVRVARFLEPRVMPYTVGSFASVILFFLMFIALRPHFVALREAALLNNTSSSSMLRYEPGYNIYQPVSRQDFADSRAPFGEQSPSLDPSGALAALTRAYSQPHTRHYVDADDMIVVTNVFSNGAASLADVVQPPKDKRMLAEFESALRQSAAFVPAAYDRRPDTMRVVITLGPKVQVDSRNF